MDKIYIGWDVNEIEAYAVCKHSIEARASDMVSITPLRHKALRHLGYFWREWVPVGAGQMTDGLDGMPFSTEFAFTRFLVPELQQFKGWALFMDCDMLLQADIYELSKYEDEKYAVLCVQHNHRPPETTKMAGAAQQIYHRKNWSSFVLWNCSHPANKKVTKEYVNSASGQDLHAFDWLEDDLIGSLPEEWNWLEGHSSPALKPKNIHFTRGGPWFDSCQDVAYADEWRQERRKLNGYLPSQYPKVA